MTVLEIKDLTVRYGRRAAVDGLNLTLESGKLYGMLGRNGAGKSTMINAILTALFPASGSIRVLGKKVAENPSVFSHMCVIRERECYPRSLRVKDALATAASLYANWDAAYAERLLDLFELEPKKKAGQLSRGMVSSLGLTVGLASRAELTIFDEPSLGLDAVARERFYRELRQEKQSGKRTFVVSTHLIDEGSRLFDDVVIIDKGKLLTQDSLDRLSEMAVMVSGFAADVEKAVEGLEVIDREELGPMLSVCVRSFPGEATERIHVGQVPLQKLFVFLSEGRMTV